MENCVFLDVPHRLCVASCALLVGFQRRKSTRKTDNRSRDEIKIAWKYKHTHRVACFILFDLHAITSSCSSLFLFSRFDQASTTKDVTIQCMPSFASQTTSRHKYAKREHHAMFSWQDSGFSGIKAATCQLRINNKMENVSARNLKTLRSHLYTRCETALHCKILYIWIKDANVSTRVFNFLFWCGSDSF